MRSAEFKTGVLRPVECFREGWEIIKDQYWMFFGITLVGILIAGFSMYILLGAMYCGIYYALLRKLNGQQAKFEDLFKGFQHFVPGLIASLVLIIPLFIYLIVTYASMFFLMFSSMDSRGRIDPSALFAVYGVMFGGMLIFGIIFTIIQAVSMFSYPLIVERHLSGKDALKTSAKAVWANLAGVAGFILVQFGLGLLGYLACGIGLYFVFPLMFAGVVAAYRKVFPPVNNQMFNQPPPPSAFQGAGNYT